MSQHTSETRYRVVGAIPSGGFSVTWHDTARAAAEHAMKFPAAVIVRPDGSRINFRGPSQDVA